MKYYLSFPALFSPIDGNSAESHVTMLFNEVIHEELDEIVILHKEIDDRFEEFRFLEPVCGYDGTNDECKVNL